MSHRYVLGDEVRLAFGFFDHDAVGTYGVTKLIPPGMDGEPQYRIKGKDGRERVISEGQIARDGLAGHLRPHSGHNPITEMFNRIDKAASRALERQSDIEQGSPTRQDPIS